MTAVKELEFISRIFFYPNFPYEVIRFDGKNGFGEGKGELGEESFGWIFVDFVPLLYERRRVARQFQIEMWLDLAQLVKELGIEKTKELSRNNQPVSYII
ncbi:MAG: hypothetical protein QW468_02620 [Candidatus Bathyarchaeia archaeon]